MLFLDMRVGIWYNGVKRGDSMNEKIFQMKQLSATIPSSLDLHFQMCGTTYPNKTYAINRMASRVCCVEYVLSGTGHVRVGDTEFCPRAGDAYFLPQGMPHLYGSNKHDPFEKIWVNFGGKAVDDMIRQYGIEGKFHFPALDISDLLLKMQYYTDHAGLSDRGEKCVSLLHAIFYRLSASCEPKTREHATPVQAMLAYIDRHETDMISLEELAAVCKKSPSQAERLFKKETGMPPYRYILNRKIELARQLLRETGMSVRDISAYLSFSDEFYFSGLFRRKTGCSPTQYRQNPPSDSEQT